MPGTAPGGIDITVAVLHATAGAVPYALGAPHVADKCSLLKEAVPAHPATEERSLDRPFCKGKQTPSGRQPPEWSEGRLPPAYGSEKSHPAVR